MRQVQWLLRFVVEGFEYASVSSIGNAILLCKQDGFLGVALLYPVLKRLDGPPSYLLEYVNSLSGHR